MRHLITALLVALLPSISAAQTTVTLRTAAAGYVTINGATYSADSVSFSEFMRYGTMRFDCFHVDMHVEEFGHRVYFTSPIWQDYTNYLDGDNGNTPFASGDDVENWFIGQGVAMDLTW